MSTMPTTRWRLGAALFALYAIWGSTYLAISVAVGTLPPLLMAGTRFVIAGAGMYVILRLLGVPAPERRHWRSTAIVGALLLLGGNGLVCIAEQWVASGIAALLVATVPLWMVVLPWLAGGPLPGWRIFAGLALGLAGVAVLGWPDQDHGIGVSGALLLFTAALSWAIGSLWSRRLVQPASPMLATAMQMLVGGAALIVVGVIGGEGARIRPEAMSGASLAALAYLITCGSVVGFGSYVWLLRHAPPALATSYAYVNPLVAMLLGWAFNHEALGARTAIAAACIVAAVALIAVGTRPAASADAADGPGAEPARATVRRRTDGP